VDKANRGSGIFERLYETLWALLPSHYEVAVALVSTSNPRSLAAHKKIGMIEVDQFVYNDKTYNTVAKKLDRPGD
jgi:L-amino acid N-acyltransferase YncA